MTWMDKDPLWGPSWGVAGHMVVSLMEPHLLLVFTLMPLRKDFIHVHFGF